LVERPGIKNSAEIIYKLIPIIVNTDKGERIMSRIGKLPIELPQGVEVKVNDHDVTIKGSLGTETVHVRPEISVKVEDGHIVVSRADDSRQARSLHGLSRTLIANAVHGVTKGFEKRLEIQGVGYRANMEGTNLNLALGYSHPVLVVPPAGITISVDKNTLISVKGTNKQTVGDVAAEIRGKRPPEVYKGKGIRYEGEYIRRKAGKAGKK
jgi:large subunit ribosomal protein L6